MACLFLAGKLDDNKMDVLNVVDVCYSVQHGESIDTSSSAGKELCTKVLDLELLLLQAIGFNLLPDVPYGIAFQYLKQLFTITEEKGKMRVTKEQYTKIAQFTWWFINASLKTPLCLVYSAEDIAVSCIQAATDMPVVDDAQKSYKLELEWWKAMGSTLKREQYEEIANQFVESVEQESFAGVSGTSVSSQLAKK